MRPPNTALITGVSRGIGEATARHLMDRGFSVFGIDRESPAADLRLEQFSIADLKDLDSLPTVVDELLRGVDGLNVLVNNAAIQHCAPMKDLSSSLFREVLDVNLVAPLMLAKQCLPRLKRVKGTIVNVSSVHAIATSRGISAYAASKGGLVALTRAMSLELAGDGVRVNAVLPGAVDTKMLAEGLERDEKNIDLEKKYETFAARHPLGRIGLPSDIAGVIAFLADTSQSGYMTGATLVVDGGVTARLSTEVEL